MVHPHAAIHPLTPGSPAYAFLKFAAVGGLFGLRAYFARRDRRTGGEDESPRLPPPDHDGGRSHPVSQRKARRRRRRRG